jgi:hypothetical protein
MGHPPLSIALELPPSGIKLEWSKRSVMNSKGQASLPMHRPMACDHQMSEQDFMSGVALSHRPAVDDGISLGYVKPSDWDIC